VVSEAEMMSWKERRDATALERKVPRSGWEARAESDPFRSSSSTPTYEYQGSPDPFTSWFLAVGMIESDAMLKRRGNLWLKHMQWARRSALAHCIFDATAAGPRAEGEGGSEGESPHLRLSPFLAEYPVKVDWEYTLLSEDCMKPVGQVIAFKANSSAAVREYLAKEPLQVGGALGAWQVLDMNIRDDMHDSLSHDMRPNPYMFYGLYGGAKSADHSDTFEKSMEHHADLNAALLRNSSSVDLSKQTRVSCFAQLGAFDTPENSLKRVREFAGEAKVHDMRTGGVLMVFSARSDKDARAYLAEDPSIGAAGGLFGGETNSHFKQAVSVLLVSYLIFYFYNCNTSSRLLLLLILHLLDCFFF
jgi:hypothetical protein